MKRIVSLILALLALSCCLYGCGSTPDLTGRWEAVSYYDSDSVLEEFEAFDLYEEEIALLDPAGMGICDVLVLNEDMTYTITYDAAKSMALVEEYYRGVFATLYENRAQLEEVYGEDFTSMTEDEFQLFYATMYGASSFDSLIYMFVGTLDDYAYLEEDPEVGTYRVTLNRIYFTIDGTSTEEYVTFSLDDGSLSVDYTDNTVTYTKAE